MGNKHESSLFQYPIIIWGYTWKSNKKNSVCLVTSNIYNKNGIIK